MHIELNTNEKLSLLPKGVENKIGELEPTYRGFFARSGISAVSAVTIWSDSPQGTDYWAGIDTIYRRAYIVALEAKIKVVKIHLGIVKAP